MRVDRPRDISRSPSTACTDLPTAQPAIWLFDLLRYLLPAGLITFALYKVPASWCALHRVQLRVPEPGQRRREFLNSMVTVLVFSINGVFVHLGAEAAFCTCTGGLRNTAGHIWPVV